MKRARHTRARGFTLIEVMIAVSISAIIGVLVAGSFQRTIYAKDLIESQDERYSAVRLAMTRMSREISMAFLSERYDHKRFRERPTIFKGNDSGDRDSLIFTAFAHERLFRDAKESDQSLLEYKLDTDPDHQGLYALFRREKVHLDTDPERGGTLAMLCDNVTSLDFAYWDWKKKDWTNEWSTASAERASQLPLRVRIRLEVKMPDGKNKKFETQTRIAMIRPLD